MEPNQDIKIVFRMTYAAKMRMLGHKLLSTMPNPNDSRYTCWIFEDDDTFDQDLHNIIKEGRRNG